MKKPNEISEDENCRVSVVKDDDGATVHFQMTDQLYRQIKKAAKASGLSPDAYLRERILSNHDE